MEKLQLKVVKKETDVTKLFQIVMRCSNKKISLEAIILVQQLNQFCKIL